MEITFTVPDERAAFMLEMLHSINYVSNPRPRRARKAAVPAAEMDTSEYLLSSKANAEHLRRSFEQLDRGEFVRVEIPAEWEASSSHRMPSSSTAIGRKTTKPGYES